MGTQTEIAFFLAVMEASSPQIKYLKLKTLPWFLAENTLHWETIIAQIDFWMEQAGWTIAYARRYLKETYGVSSRRLLTDEQLFEFLEHLQSSGATEIPF